MVSAATALRARPAVVLVALAQQAPILLGVVVPPALAALAFGEWMLAAALAPQVLVLAGVAFSYRDGLFPRDLRHVEAMVTFALMFTLASLLVAPPFLVLGMPLLDALFEAVSGVTSTGLSLATGTEGWPIPAHLLRGWIQWCGGFAIAFAGLAIFSGSARSSVSIGASTLAERDPMTSMKRQAQQVLIVYAALSLIAVALCLLVLPNWWEALSIALAAVSTGGFSPRGDSLGSYTPLAQGVVIGICVSTAISLLFYIRIRRDGWREALHHSHALATLGLMAGGLLIFVLVDFLVNESDWPTLYGTALNFLSGFSTAGFSTGEVSGHVALLPLLLLAMVIGGDVGSTAGGIKVSRIILLARMVKLSLLRVRVPPSAVTYLGDAGSRVTEDRVIAVAALLVCYLTTLILGWLIFLASGIAPLAGLFEIVSALSTVGLSQGVATPDLAPHLKLTLVVLMLLGRLEFIALIILCLPGTWLKRS